MISTIPTSTPAGDDMNHASIVFRAMYHVAGVLLYGLSFPYIIFMCK